MTKHKACGLLFSALMTLAVSGCALIPSEQNPLPQEVLNLIAKRENSAASDAETYPVYTGTYYCAQGTTGISLKILGGDGSQEIFGIFRFFPIPSNPNVPPGSFVVKGIFDESRGLMDLKPVSWLTRPSGFLAAGLRGSSIDRGNTFEGEVTGVGFLCSTFDIKKSEKPF